MVHVEEAIAGEGFVHHGLVVCLDVCWHWIGMAGAVCEVSQVGKDNVIGEVDYVDYCAELG